MKKRILSILLVFCMIFSMMPMSASAATDSSTLMQISSATQEKLGLSDSDVQRYEGYYAIRNAADLFAYGELLAGTYDPVNAILLHDIFLEWGTMWTPLCMNGGGIFEGNGKTIGGIQVNMPDAEAVGFFSYVANGTIRNLTIGSSDGTPSSIIGKVAVGAIAGQIAGSTTIENCAAKNVKLKAQTDDPLSYIGGLVGHATSLDGVKRSVIENSYFGGTITVYNSSTGNVGCIIGDHTHVTVSNCTWLADHAKICDHDSNLVAVVNRGTGDRYDTTYEDFQGELLSGTGDSHTHRSVTTTSLTATCEYGGYDSYSYCLVCDAILAGNKNQTEAHHEYAGGTCATEARCTICGAAGQKTTDHEYVGGNCTTEARCTICGGAGQKKPDLHSWSYGKCEWCSKPCNHSYDSDSMCTICRATCPHQQYENGTCKECGNSGILARFDIGGNGMGLRVQERVKNSSDNTYTIYPRELVKKTEENDGIQLVLIEPGKIYAFILEIDDAQKPGGFVSIHVDGIPTVANLNTSYHSDGDTVFSICDHSDTEGTKCNACGKQLHTCTPGDTWTYNGTRHWRVCADSSCGLVMDYETHTISSDTGRCVGCNRSCEHVWNDHNTCTKCGYTCEHYFVHLPPISVGTLCGICHFKCEHTWENGHCSMCNYDCAHSIIDGDGFCTLCGAPCPHEFANGVCTACGAECTHTWENGHCGTCDLTCSHSIVDGICEICGAPCPHEFVNSICTVCGVPCVHDFATGECSFCGIPCPHDYEVTLQHGPFCTAEGLVNYRCTDCGNEYHEILPSLGGHKYNYTVTDTNHTGVCEVCEDLTSGFHNYSREYFDPTCTEDGYYADTCTDCGYSKKTVTNQKLNHYGGEATCKELAVCERCGEGYGEYADHMGGEATCTEPAACEICGEGYGELKRHESDLDDGDCTTPVCCYFCGAVTKEGNATHTWDENNFCSNENCQETRGFTFTFTYGDEVLFVRNVHTGSFYTFEDFEARDGLTLVGWEADEDADEDGEPDFYPIGDYTYVEGDLSFNAVYKLMYTVRFITYDIWENQYTESFNPIMGEANQTVTLWDDSSPYYKFLGWAMEEDGEVVYEANEEITLTENLTLYGVIRPYQATFELGEGAVWNDENGNPITVLEGDYSGSWIEIRKFPTRTGYIFKGFMDQTEWLWEPWQDEDTGEWVVDFYFDRSDLVMTAVWEECTEHSYADGECELCGVVCAHDWVDDVCTICGKECEHSWNDEGICASCGAESHVHTPDDCGQTCKGYLCADCGRWYGEANINGHSYDNACDADCNICGATREVGDHVYQNDCDADCDNCGETREVGGHIYDEGCYDLDCNSCGESRITGHTLTYHEAKIPANCQEEGYEEYWTCSVCGAYFGSADASLEINPDWIYYTGEHVRPEGSAPCAVVPCEICGEDSYGLADCDRGDAPECQDACCIYCGEYMWGKGCSYGYDEETWESLIPLCQPGDCIYCGTHYEKLYDCENDSWAPCSEAGECVYGCGKQYAPTGEHDVDDPCAGGLCWFCWEDIAPVHSYDNACDADCNICGATREVGEHVDDDDDNACDHCDTQISTGSAQITDVSITVDGKEYGQGETAIITPDTESLIFTVSGKNFANLNDEQSVIFAEGMSFTTNIPYWEVDDVNNTATLDLSLSVTEFEVFTTPTEILISNDCGETLINTGVYLQYSESPTFKIVQQPVSVTGTIGETVSVNVVATGEGLTYQWYIRNGSGSWSLSSITTATYEVVMNKSRANRELYCVITDANGNTLKSDVVSMTGQPDEELAILRQPVNAEAKLGENYCVEVIAQGDGLKYQWYFRNKGQTNWTSSSVKDNTYDDVMNSSRVGREVYCVITDAWGNSVTTDTVTLIGLPEVELAIVEQPADVSAKIGEQFVVSVEAVGEGLRYTWYWRQIGAETWNISGQKDNTYDAEMTASRHNREVYCVVTDAFGNTVSTDIATITGIPTRTLEITEQPEDQTVPLGDMFHVSVKAQGEGIRYQWYFRRVGSEAWTASGQKDNSYDDVMTAARHNREIYCVITDAWGNTVETSPVVLLAETSKQELSIVAQPEDTSVKMGESFCVTVEAQGDGLKYQWYWRNVGAETWNSSGQRDNTYDDVMTRARHNREVYCVITDMWGESVETDVVTITAVPGEALAIIVQPTDAYAAMGENYCVTVEAQGHGLKYQWHFRNKGSNVWHKSGVTDNTYDDVLNKSRAGREVYCVITDIWGNSVTTDTVTLVCTDNTPVLLEN